jgi:hypothetical protein
MAADGQPKSGAPVFACERRVRLKELLEQPPNLFFGHSYPGVGHANYDPVPLIDPLRLRGDYDSALFGELGGVVRNVKQDLPQAGLISVDNSKTRWAIDDEAVAIL